MKTAMMCGFLTLFCMLATVGFVAFNIHLHDVMLEHAPVASGSMLAEMERQTRQGITAFVATGIISGILFAASAILGFRDRLRGSHS